VVGDQANRTLVAQKTATSGNQAFSGKVFYASLSGGKLTTSSVVPLPFQINIYDFNLGPLGTSRTPMVSAIKFPTEHLIIYERTGEKSWESYDSYCGTVNSISKLSYGDEGRNVEYVPSRIILADIDKDGANEVIVAKNNQGGIPFMKNLRAFNSGVIEARKFSNISLIPFFNSSNILPGPAVDYQLADLDNNGTNDLVVAVVIEAGSGMLQDARSIIVSYSDLYTPQVADSDSGKGRRDK
jgi:hypothetical protein